ncbi:hypothetical protein IID19_05490 [Patescibacteria group bacterium]|nr:hypothetical protein [Patescibacteria group bacterium]
MCLKSPSRKIVEIPYNTKRAWVLNPSVPPKDEVELLLQQLKKLEKRRFKSNVKKIIDYVGGEPNARKLIKRLGIKLDIFDMKKVRATSAH